MLLVIKDEAARKAGSTLSVACGTMTEHTLVKLEIKSDTDYIFIRHGPSVLADLLRTMLNYYFVYGTLSFEFYKYVFGESVTHDW